MNAPIDLRSDTVTQPSPAMRRAMASAEVGDAHFGDDPTVNRLQELAAELTGRQAAIYLPTGTMCNQVALHALVRSGHQVVCEATAHVASTEAAASAVLSGIAFARVPAARGQLTADLVATALEPDPRDVRVVDLVEIENTHETGGGSVLSVAEVQAIAAVCQAGRVPLYLDGARIFNACAATGATVGDYAGSVSAMMFCLSKGLGAPIGSMLVGDTEFIREARRLKMMLGGSWRQAGVLAAAGLIALAEGPGRLHEDHANAKRLAEGVAEILPGSVDPAEVGTNIVFVRVDGTGRTAAQWAGLLAAEGVRVTTGSGTAGSSARVRMLTHLDIATADVDAALAAWRRAARAAKATAS